MNRAGTGTARAPPPGPWPNSRQSREGCWSMPPAVSSSLSSKNTGYPAPECGLHLQPRDRQRRQTIQHSGRIRLHEYLYVFRTACRLEKSAVVCDLCRAPGMVVTTNVINPSTAQQFNGGAPHVRPIKTEE